MTCRCTAASSRSTGENLVGPERRRRRLHPGPGRHRRKVEGADSSGPDLSRHPRRLDAATPDRPAARLPPPSMPCRRRDGHGPISRDWPREPPRTIMVAGRQVGGPAAESVHPLADPGPIVPVHDGRRRRRAQGRWSAPSRRPDAEQRLWLLDCLESPPEAPRDLLQLHLMRPVTGPRAARRRA